MNRIIELNEQYMLRYVKNHEIIDYILWCFDTIHYYINMNFLYLYSASNFKIAKCFLRTTQHFLNFGTIILSKGLNIFENRVSMFYSTLDLSRMFK